MKMSAIRKKLTEDVYGSKIHPPKSNKRLGLVQEAARQRFIEIGTPLPKDEYWRFTSPEPFLSKNISEAPVSTKPQLEFFAKDTAIEINFIDGKLAHIYGNDDIEGIEIVSLSKSIESEKDWVVEVFGELEMLSQKPTLRPLATLNSGFCKEGVAIRISGEISQPIVINYTRSNLEADIFLRNIVKLEKSAKATLVENGDAAARVNNVLEVDIDKNAIFNHLRVQGRDKSCVLLNHIFSRQASDSIFRSFTTTLNGSVVRNEIYSILAGVEAKLSVSGAVIGNGNSFHHDDTIFINHKAENCQSRQIFKKVLKEGSTGVFQGKILVDDVAQKTDGYQISKGLLLSDNSKFLAKPELEIYADDVICSHGSTCGSIDEVGLFYLTSRGIPREKAINMLVLAFLDEAIQEIDDENLAGKLREVLANVLEQ